MTAREIVEAFERITRNEDISFHNHDPRRDRLVDKLHTQREALVALIEAGKACRGLCLNVDAVQLYDAAWAACEKAGGRDGE